ncbi:MAG: DUF4157 domain-containing protein [bacterium]|nr:DUF4157 domain-containing protein [bacterium]
MADQVMRMPEPGLAQRTAIPGISRVPNIQRQCTECEEGLQRQPEEEEQEEEKIQTKPLAHQITPLVQRVPEPGCPGCEGELQRQPEEEPEEETMQAKDAPGRSPGVTPGVEAGIHALSGSGRPLPESTRSYFEPRFGQDFSRVRVYTGSDVARVNRSLNAHAFTKGRDIYFGAGNYSPGTSSGKKLLAHELTHVVQQNGADVQTKNRDNKNPDPIIQSKLVTPGQMVQKYGKNVHFDMTHKEALKVPFSKGDARIIADADQAVDEGWSHPWISTPLEFINPFVSGKNMLHFPARSVASKEITAAIKSCDLKKFGKALHRLQDTYSHSFPPGVVSPKKIAASYCWKIAAAAPFGFRTIAKLLVGKILYSHPLYGRWAVLKHSCLGFYPEDYNTNPEQAARDNNMTASTRKYLGLLQGKCASLATPLIFTSTAFSAGTGGAIIPTPRASDVEIASAPYSPSGTVEVSGGTDALAKGWEAGFIQAITNSKLKAHYIGSKKEKLRTEYIPGPRRDALVSGGAPWYDPNNSNGPGRVGFKKTNSSVDVSLWDQPVTYPPWKTPDKKGKLDHHDGKDIFTAWMIVREKKTPNTIHYLNWTSWEVDYSVTFNYASTGSKTVKKITGSTKNTGSDKGKGKVNPVLSGKIANDSIKTVWS